MMNSSVTYLNGKPIDAFSNRGFLIKVFSFLFLALFFSSLVCLVSSKILLNILSSGDVSKISEVSGEYVTVLIVSTILLGILYLIISIRKLKMKSVLIPFILYALITGILLSTLVVFTGNIYFFASLLGITSIIFLFVTFFALIFNGKMNVLYSILLSAFLAAIILVIVNIFLFPIMFKTESAFDSGNALYWALDFIILFIVIISTLIDINRIKRMSKFPNSNFAIYCSFVLFVDYIGVLFRIAKILLRILSKTKK